MKSINISDYIINRFIDEGVSDIFGVPGGVILELLYAAERRRNDITPHLFFHEQDAIFAAAGFSQTKGTIGVAYATRGPGITNMTTGIADAFYDSIPLIVITAHSSVKKNSDMRIEADQELDTISVFRSITKYVIRIDKVEDFFNEFNRACKIAVSGRKGPILLDISTNLLTYTFHENSRICHAEKQERMVQSNLNEIVDQITYYLSESMRPILLIGDGIHQAGVEQRLKSVAEKLKIPVLSSRGAQDVLAGSDLYYGFIGSHGIRYSNFILSKCDLIIALGNRMSFPLESVSYSTIFKKAVTIRIEVDKGELNREIPNSISFIADLKDVIPALERIDYKYENALEWKNICEQIKKQLDKIDTNLPVNRIAEILSAIKEETVIVSDVGNNEFWLSYAYVESSKRNRIIYSRSYGTLGNSLGKAIGAYYATRDVIMCFVGDQGIQFCIQELQYIAYNKIPIKIVIINNQSSGMIRSRQKQKYDSHFIHTTIDSGYSAPDFQRIATAYKIRYHNITELNIETISSFLNCQAEPDILELKIEDIIDLDLRIPVGYPCQMMLPAIDSNLYTELDNL